MGYSKCIRCVQYVYFTDLIQSIEIIHHTQIKVTFSAEPNTVGRALIFPIHFRTFTPSYMTKNIDQKNVPQGSYGVLKKKDQSPKLVFWAIEKIYFLWFSPFFLKALKCWRNWVIRIKHMGTTRSDQFQKLQKCQILWPCNFFHAFDTNKRIVAINYVYSANKIPKVLAKTFDPYFQKCMVFTDIHS